MVDVAEAAVAPFGHWITAALPGRPIGWAVRTDDLGAVATRLGLTVHPGSRLTPDGAGAPLAGRRNRGRCRRCDAALLHRMGSGDNASERDRPRRCLDREDRAQRRQRSPDHVARPERDPPRHRPRRARRRRHRAARGRSDDRARGRPRAQRTLSSRLNAPSSGDHTRSRVPALAVTTRVNEPFARVLVSRPSHSHFPFPAGLGRLT